MNKKGFTLAEVLIVLAVIGVIAAISIPGLMSSTNDSETIAGVKKAQGVLANAISLYEQQNDCIGDFGACGLYDDFPSLAEEEVAWNKLNKVFNIAKDCGLTNTSCMPTNLKYKSLNPNNAFLLSLSSSSFAKALLADGSYLLLDVATAPPEDYSISHDSSKPMANVYATIYYDINGAKMPNTRGKDLFLFYLTKYGVIPSGNSDEAGGSDCAYDNEGYTCAGWILQHNNMNYPATL